MPVRFRGWSTAAMRPSENKRRCTSHRPQARREMRLAGESGGRRDFDNWLRCLRQKFFRALYSARVKKLVRCHASGMTKCPCEMYATIAGDTGQGGERDSRR